MQWGIRQKNILGLCHACQSSRFFSSCSNFEEEFLSVRAQGCPPRAIGGTLPTMIQSLHQQDLLVLECHLCGGYWHEIRKVEDLLRESELKRISTECLASNVNKRRGLDGGVAGLVRIVSSKPPNTRDNIMAKRWYKHPATTWRTTRLKSRRSKSGESHRFRRW